MGESAAVKDLGFAGPSLWLEAGVPLHIAQASARSEQTPHSSLPESSPPLQKTTQQFSVTAKEGTFVSADQCASSTANTAATESQVVGQQQAPCWDRTGACQRRVTPLQTHSGPALSDLI